MEPGRELDALVAEKVMRLVVRKIKVVGGGVRSNVDDVGTVDPPRRMPDGRMGVHAAVLPAYSTDIAAAFEALEKDDGAGWDFTLTRYAASSMPWQVEASRHVDGLVISEAGETCALAICRVLIKTSLAALKAVEQK